MTRAAALLVLVMSGPAVAQDEGRTCVDVRVGDQSSYGCVNDALRRLATRPKPTVATGTLDATSPPAALGLFDRAATAQRMGSNFGHSAFAARPGAPVYANPLLPPR